MTLRSAVNYDRRFVSVKTGTVNDEPSLTRQADAADADINVIVKRFGITGALPQVPLPPTYQQFADEVFDFQSAANLIRSATESFAALDADVRARFANDPARFVDFCSKSDNLPEMAKLGLVLPEPTPEVPPPPMKVEVVNAPSAKGST